MKQATREQSDAFCAFMSNEFHCRIVTRNDAIEFKLIRGLLSSWGIPDITQILAERSFTIGPLVYLSDTNTPDQTIETVTHECQHVVQEEREGLKIAAMYLLEGEARGMLEAEAYRAGAEVTFARTKVLPTLDEMTARLDHGYGLSKDSLKLTRKFFDVAGTALSHGLYSTESARAAIAWLANHYPELLA